MIPQWYQSLFSNALRSCVGKCIRQHGNLKVPNDTGIGRISNLKITFVTSQQLNTKWIIARLLLHWHKWQNKIYIYIHHYINDLWLEITTISVTRAYMFQIDPFKLSHLPLDFHPSKPFKTKVVLLCRICQLQSIRRSNKSRACGQCQHGYNLTQALNLTMGSKSSKLRRLERFQVLVHPKILGHTCWLQPKKCLGCWCMQDPEWHPGGNAYSSPRVPAVPKWMPSDPNHTATSGARQDHAQDSSKDHRCLFQGVGWSIHQKVSANNRKVLSEGDENACVCL